MTMQTEERKSQNE